MTIGRVQSLARYPVKSMQGEDLRSVDVELRGLAGDRRWAVRTADGGIGSGKNSSRFRRLDGLLDHRAELDGGQPPLVVSPDGQRHRCGDPAADAMLSAAFQQPVRLQPESDVPYHDDSSVHLVTTAALRFLEAALDGPVDPRRLRANVVLDVDGAGFVEDEWLGRELAVGDDVVLALGPGMPRCRMVDLPQPGLGPAPRLLKALAELHDLELGLQASVHHPGVLRVGDPAVLR